MEAASQVRSIWRPRLQAQMPMNDITTIAGRSLRVDPGELTTLRFSGGRLGDDEAGTFEFWTVFNQERAVTARCLKGSDPGERFRRMEGVPGYHDYWQVSASATGIRPATRTEVLSWLNGHPEDAAFVASCQIGIKPMRIVKAGDGFHFEDP